MWNRGLLIILNMVCTIASQVAKQRKSYDIIKLKNIRKISKLHRIIDSTQSFSWNENFLVTIKKFLEYRNWTFQVVLFFTWNLFVSNILSLIADLCKTVILVRIKIFFIQWAATFLLLLHWHYNSEVTLACLTKIHKHNNLTKW